MAAAFRAAALPIVMAMLGACGGGGGGGGVVAVAPVASEPPPVSFASAGANQTIVMEGKSAVLDTTVSLSDVTWTPTDDGTIDNATVKFSFDSARQLSGIHITSPQATLSFDAIKCQGGVCSTRENVSSFAVVIDPFAQGWNYQTFGIWGMEGTQFPSIRMGATSAGGPTSGNSVPRTGSATFKGLAAGLYIDPAGTLWATAASMRADVNFGVRTISFSTSNTMRGADVTAPTSASIPDGNLNLFGTFLYARGMNNFSGMMQSQNGALSGWGEGKFYGATAEEIGGVYSLSGSGPSRMIGGFGGKR